MTVVRGCGSGARRTWNAGRRGAWESLVPAEWGGTTQLNRPPHLPCPFTPTPLTAAGSTMVSSRAEKAQLSLSTVTQSWPVSLPLFINESQMPGAGTHVLSGSGGVLRGGVREASNPRCAPRLPRSQVGRHRTGSGPSGVKQGH